MLPALRGSAVFVPDIIRVCPSGLYASVFIWMDLSILYGYSSFWQTACLYFCLYRYTVFHVCCFWGGGVSGRWWGGGSRLPVLAVFIRWSPWVGHLSKLVWGWVVSALADARWLVCLQWCLSGGGGVLSGRARSLPWVFSWFGGEGMCGHVFWELVLSFCRKQTCFWIMNTTGIRCVVCNQWYKVWNLGFGPATGRTDCCNKNVIKDQSVLLSAPCHRYILFAPNSHENFTNNLIR